MNHNYATKEAFDTYIDYLAIKKHFTTKTYDYQKYNGKVNASFNSFQTRNDAFFFYKLSQNPNSKNIILSNIISNPNIWIRDILEERGIEVYTNWKKRIDSLAYQFQQDLKILDDDYKSNFIVVGGQHPKLLVHLLQNKISIETFTILTNISKVLGYWEEKVIDKIVAYDKMLLSRKYFPFLDINKERFAKIIKTNINSV